MIDVEEYKDLTFAEGLFKFYGDTILQMYLGEKAGSTYYADHDSEQKLFLVCIIKAAIGDMLIVETAMDNGRKLDAVINAGWIKTVVPAVTDRNERSIFVKYLQETRR